MVIERTITDAQSKGSQQPNGKGLKIHEISELDYNDGNHKSRKKCLRMHLINSSIGNNYYKNPSSGFD